MSRKEEIGLRSGGQKSKKPRPGETKHWDLYLLRCRDGALYTGVTTDVKRRMAEHRGQGQRGAKYLRGRGPLTLVRKFRIGKKSDAYRIEYRVKKLAKEKKEELLAGGIKVSTLLPK